MRNEKAKNITKLKISSLKSALIFVGVITVVAIGLYFINPPSWPPSTLQYVVIAIWLALSIFLTIVAIKMNYYTYNRYELVRHIFTKEYVIKYKDVLYIDVEWSKKHSSLLIFTSLGHERYLPFDKERKILDLMQERCTHLISKEEYLAKFPNAKIK